MRWLGLLAVVLVLCSCACFQRPAGDVYRAVAPAAALVSLPDGSGSGFAVVGPAGETDVVTCAHVVRGWDGAVVEFPGRPPVWADVVARDEASDLALLRVDADLPVPRLHVARRDPRRYDPLYSVGAPLGYAGAAAEHVLSGELDGLWLVTGMADFGASGEVLVDSAGEVQCVMARVSSQDKMLGECVPRAKIAALLGR